MHRGKIVSTLVLILSLCIADCKRSDGAAVLVKICTALEVTTAKIISFWGTENHDMTEAGQDRSAELGLKFSSDVSAQLTGIRFYKFPANTGRHVANVWSSEGTLLASVKFTNETSSGWQKADLKESIPLQAKEMYVISYHLNKGHYAYTKNFFERALSVPPLHAPRAAGVFAYGTLSVFPQQSFENSNYWVDPVVVATPLPKTSRIISLTWKASTTPNVTYNVYRKNALHDDYNSRPVATGLKALHYDDRVMAARGDRFYYVVRSVDPANHESFNSNEVQVTISSR